MDAEHVQVCSPALWGEEKDTVYPYSSFSSMAFFSPSFSLLSI